MEKELYPERLVQRVNELYHDITADQYEHSHPEIFQQEKPRLQRIAKQFLQFAHPITILEIGTGTGFVPIAIGTLLKDSDTFICSDISAGILGRAEKIIHEQQFPSSFKFVKIERQTPYRLPFPEGSMDVVLMNSVLHHVRDTGTFLQEISRVQRSKGLLIISHEPNRYFHDNRFLRYNYLLISCLTDPKRVVYGKLRGTSPEPIVRRLWHYISPKSKEKYSQLKAVADRINTILLAEQAIDTPLMPEEVGRIVDVRDAEGFRADVVPSGFRLLHLETYDQILRKRYPRAGAKFLAVLEKEAN